MGFRRQKQNKKDEKFVCACACVREQVASCSLLTQEDQSRTYALVSEDKCNTLAHRETEHTPNALLSTRFIVLSHVRLHKRF